MAEQPTEKTCTKCGETKPLEEFSRHKQCKDGRNPYCKKCKSADDRAYREKNREAISKASRRYRERNRELLRQKQREYTSDRRDELNQKQRDYYWANRDAVLERSRRWREENAEEHRERARQYYYANREKVLGYWRRYRTEKPHMQWLGYYRARARKYGFEPVVEDFTRDDVIARYGDHCAYCETGPFEHLDHYIPVSNGGPHTLENVRPACSGCNRAKSDADPEEWLSEQAEFDALTEDEQNALIDAEIAKYLNEDA